jgi:hypothetical protein
MPEAVVSSEVNMGPTNVHMGPASAEVSDADVTAAKVASTKVTAAKVTAAAVSATTVTASTASKGRGRDCRTSQNESGGGEEQCFSQHQNLHHNCVSSATLCRRTFSVIDTMFRTMLDGKSRPVPCGNRARAPRAQLTSVLYQISAIMTR